VHIYTDADDAIAHALAQACLDRLAMSAPLDRPRAPEQLLTAAGHTVTAEGIGAGEAIRLWTEVLGPACLSIDHPRYLSFIPGAPTKASAAFDMLVGASSIYAGSWLEGAGAAVPRGADGLPAHPIEISPLVALDAAELATRVDPALDVSGPVLLS